jgi:hypothetical protein
MPRYFFHVLINGRIIPDEEGTVCQDLEAAKLDARESATDIARQALDIGVSPKTICVEIHDLDGKVLAALTVEEILKHPNNPAFGPACGARSRDEPLH